MQGILLKASENHPSKGGSMYPPSHTKVASSNIVQMGALSKKCEAFSSI
jgi:hypothetical protein